MRAEEKTTDEGGNSARRGSARTGRESNKGPAIFGTGLQLRVQAFGPLFLA